MVTTKQSGFILVLALMVLSIGVMLVTYLFHRGTGHIYFDEAMITIEKAKTLALSSLDLVQSQLSLTAQQKEKKEERKLILQQILPVVNRWQRVTLTQDHDGIDAQLYIMLSCEDGKLNINQLYDFSRKEFKTPEIKSVLQTLFTSMKRFVHDKDLFPAFEKFLKERNYPLDDVTELLSVDGFKKAFGQKKFSFPLKEQNSKEVKQAPIYLCDIFTVSTKHDTVSAWMISDSLAALLGLHRAYAGSMAERVKLAEEITKDANVDEKNVQGIWDKALKKWYGKEYKVLPKDIDKLFKASFDPSIFSVVCYAKVGSITQKLYAIIEREFDEKKGYVEFSVKKLYWI